MKNLSLTFIIVLIASFTGFAQKTADHNININIDPITLIGVTEDDGTTATSIDLSPTAPTEAGGGLDFTSATNDDLWLNYTSITSGSTTNDIKVQLSASNLPIGLTLHLTPSIMKGSGKGTRGLVNTSEVVLSDSPSAIVTGIKRCFTGKRADGENGINLLYSLKFDESKYANLTSDYYSATILYTITEN